MENSANNSLYIPPKQRWKGLTVYCYRCKTNVSEICRETGKSLKRCPNGDRHVYKAYIHVPGTANTRKTRVFPTRNIAEAIKLAMDFELEVKSGKHQNGGNKEEIRIQENGKWGIKPQTLADAMSRYIGILSNDPELVPEFRRKERSKKHIADVKRTFRYYAACMKKNNRDFNLMGIDEIDEQKLGKFHEYLLKDLGLSNRSYNKTLTIFTTFYNHLIDDGYSIKNPFKTIPRKATITNIETITEDEYARLLELIQKPELGKCELQNGVVKNLYKAWVKDAVELGLATGRRNEEIAQMKWNNIGLENGSPAYIKIQDFKVNRQRGSEAENLKYIFVPITEDLQELLLRLGYEKYKDSDKFILAPEETMERQTINTFMSRSFSHYFKKLGGRELSYKCLRKTYISSLSADMGVDNARIISKHSGKQVMEQHYIDKKFIALTAKNFSVFGKNKTRQNELNYIRNSNRKFALENER